MFLIQRVIFILILADFIYANLNCEKSGSSRSPDSKIKEKILCNYDKDYRPKKNQSQATLVSVRLVVKSIDLMEESDEFDMHNWIGLMWNDEFLTWNPDDFNSVKSIHISSSEIWVPEIKIFEEHKNDKKALTGTPDCVIQSHGLVSCVTDNMHEALCTSNVDKWPYDTRECTIRYGTGIYNSSQIRLTQKLIMSVYFENPSFKLKNSSSTLFKSKNAIDNGTYYYIRYKFQLERHSARTIALLYIPAFSLITMTLLPLWMKPGNVERFCLVASNIMSHFLFIQHMEYIVPLSGDKLPRLVSFFRDSLGLSVAVLIELTLIKSLVANRSAAPPKWLSTPCKFLSTGLFGKGLLIEETQEVTTQEDTTETNSVVIVQSENNKETNITKKSQVEKYLIATIIDRLVFAFLALVYFILAICLIPL